MNSIVYVGIDVLKESYTVCCYSFHADTIQYKRKIESDYKVILKYREQIRNQFLENTESICGYEAGCL